MNSKIYKRPPEAVEITDPKISGIMLSRKLESWCEAEPLVLMWEINHSMGAARQFLAADQQGLAFNNNNVQEMSGHWTIEFQFVRANARQENGSFDGAIIIAGYIKNSLEVTNDGGKARSQEAYQLSLNSRNIRAEKTFLSAVDLWQTLTGLGAKKPNNQSNG